MAAEEGDFGIDGVFEAIGAVKEGLEQLGGAAVDAVSGVREKIHEQLATVEDFIAGAPKPNYVIVLAGQDSEDVYKRFLRNCHAILHPDNPLLNIPEELKEIAQSAYQSEDGENLVDLLIRLRRLIQPMPKNAAPLEIKLRQLSLNLYKSLIELYEMKELARVPKDSPIKKVNELHAEFVKLYILKEFDIRDIPNELLRQYSSFFNGPINISNAMAQASKEYEDAQWNTFIQRVQGVDPLKWRNYFEENLAAIRKSVEITATSEEKLRAVLEQFNEFMQAQQRIQARPEGRVEAEVGEGSFGDVGMRMSGSSEKHEEGQVTPPPSDPERSLLSLSPAAHGGSLSISSSLSVPHADTSVESGGIAVSSFGVHKPSSPSQMSILLSGFVGSEGTLPKAESKSSSGGPDSEELFPRRSLRAPSPVLQGASSAFSSSASGVNFPREPGVQSPGSPHADPPRVDGGLNADGGSHEKESSPDAYFMLEFLMNAGDWIGRNPKKAIAIGVVACLAVAIGISIATCGAGAVLAGFTVGGLAIAGHPITSVLTGLAVVAPAVVAGIMGSSGFFKDCSSKQGAKVASDHEPLTPSY